MKATIKELQDCGLEMLNGVINAVKLNERNMLLMKILLEDDEEIFIELSNKELCDFYEYFILGGIIDTRKYMLEHSTSSRENFQKLGKLDYDAGNIIKEDFLDKEVVVTKQELNPGDAIIQIDSKTYINPATQHWTKYMLYSWQ